MGLVIETSTVVPLATDPDGIIRVARSRVTLDSVVGAFHQGATAEEIAQQYPTLALADVYAVLGHYLRHQPEIDAYLAERSVLRQAVRAENEQRFNPQSVRAGLLARRVPGRPS